VGETCVLLHRDTALGSPMDDLITRAYRAVTGADVALSHGWRYGTPLLPGPITNGDLWQMIPTNPRLFTARLTGAALRRLLETSLECAFAGDPMRQQGGYVMRAAGLHAVVRLNNPAGHRVLQLEIGGAAAVDDREYMVAGAVDRRGVRRGAFLARRTRLRPPGP
jgi:2',3'-cyclic-nucleotide 2'-phosphodiesterase (5'-nucleotidase family)